MVGAERCLNKMSIYFQIMLTSFMSAVIPTSAGAVPFYDDLHCKKFAYRREPGVLPMGRGIKILIGVFEWKESWFFIAARNTIMPSSDMCSLLSVENLHLSEQEVSTKQTQVMMRIRNKTYFEGHIKIGNLFELHVLIQAVSCLGSNFGELGKSKTTSPPHRTLHAPFILRSDTFILATTLNP